MSTSDFKQSPSITKNPYLKNRRLSELRDSIIKHKVKTQSEGKSQLPNITTTARSTNPKAGGISNQKLLSISNRHLRYLFHEFCKQSYIGGSHGTFDDIATSAEVMTMNKWMTFCREFGLLDRLSGRELGQIFKLVTHERPHLNIQEFCNALGIIKERININPESFAADILHVDSHQATRNRLGVMRINFSGPKKNFFVQSTLTQQQRKSETKKQLIFKQEQRQYILHQGMFSEHIETAMQERKNIRRERAEKLKNRSMLDDHQQQRSRNDKQKNLAINESLVEKYRRQPMIQVSPTATSKKSRSVFGNYSKIFEIKKASNTGSTHNGSNLYSNRSHLTARAQENTQSKSRIAFEQRKLNGSDIFRNQDREEDKAIEENEPTWQINSDAESDQILRQHYQNQKRNNNHSKSKSKQKVIDDSKWGQKSAFEKSKQEEDDNDMMITRYK